MLIVLSVHRQPLVYERSHADSLGAIDDRLWRVAIRLDAAEKKAQLLRVPEDDRRETAGPFGPETKAGGDGFGA
jgi:hypothetical protein